MARVETTGDPDHISLIPDRTEVNADGEDLAVVTVAVVDKQGRPVPDADNDISFTVEGGSIIGVGNGDHSSHERDMFVDSVITTPIQSWARSTASHKPNSDVFLKTGTPTKVNISDNASSMPPHSDAVYEAPFDVTPEMLKSKLTLNIGQVDDFGWVFVNGKEVGKTTDWDASYDFDISSIVHPGQNSVSIGVRNDDGPGGLGRGVSITYSKPAEQWHRSVFHALAQVIVQSSRKAGSISLSASSNGLGSASTKINTKPAEFRGYEP